MFLRCWKEFPRPKEQGEIFGYCREEQRGNCERWQGGARGGKQGLNAGPRFADITPGQFGNGFSSSASNTPPPFDRGAFPPIHVADDVIAQHRLLTEHFGINEIQLVLGWSIGAMQTYEWAVPAPASTARISASPLPATGWNPGGARRVQHFCSLAYFEANPLGSSGPRTKEGTSDMTFSVKSNSFQDGDYLRQEHVLSADFGFGCAGGNKSPHLAWSGAPAGTKSFAVTCYDPDAPTGSGFWHWLVVNIPPNVTELEVDAGNRNSPNLPSGALQTRTDYGTPGYGGPCPPPGDHPHRYLFTVFAVGAERLEVAADTSAAVIGFQLNFNTLAKATLMGLYKR